MDTRAKAFLRLLDIMDDLREKCPWDKEQTFKSLRILTIEETYELVDAIMDEDLIGIEEEIGDLLLHMVFYAKLGSEIEAFDISSALNKVCDKLIERHPHIYGDVQVENEQDVKRNWEMIKKKTGKKSILQGVPNTLPALVKAYRLQDKTAQVGFEWEKVEQVWQKLYEELDELKEATNEQNQAHIEEEFGDLLFSMINLSRYYKVDPELALESVNKKFKRRFEYIERQAPKELVEMSLEEMDHLWEEAKRDERS